MVFEKPRKNIAVARGVASSVGGEAGSAGGHQASIVNWLRSLMKSRYLWAVMGGLLLAASFPNLSVAGLAWIAPGFILMAAFGKPGKQAFRIGYVGGFAHYLV